MSPADVAEQLVRLFPALSESEARVALAIYRLLAGDSSVTAHAVAEHAGVPEAQLKTLLSTWPGVFRDEAGDVIGFWGLARPEMRHMLIVAGRLRYAWCAWDTLFIPELLRMAAGVDSKSGLDQQPVRLYVTPEEVTVDPGIREEVYVSFRLPQADDWEDNIVTTFCHHVHFLLGDEAQRWVDQNTGGAILTLQEAFDAGRRKNAFQFGTALASDDSVVA